MLEREMVADSTARDPNAPLQSLQKDRGAGALLAAAAGDVAGGRVPGSYSANTQVGTVFAYHLMRNDRVDRDVLAAELLLLDGLGETHQVYRGETSDLRTWLDSAKAGAATASASNTSGVAARALSAGLRHRQDFGGLVDATTTLAAMMNLDAPSVVMAAAAAGAVAASTFHQIGKELFVAVAETTEHALIEIGRDRFRYSNIEAAEAIPARLRALGELVDADLREIVSTLSEDNGPIGTDGVLLAIAIAGNKHFDAVKLIDTAAQSGGSDVGSIVGAIVGARQATSMWPWRVPNDTWFAEIGRRLVSGETETRDLPIPYAVEERPLLKLDMIPSNDE